MTTNQLSFGDITLTQGSSHFDQHQAWLIKGIIPQQSFGVLYGAPDTMKSFSAIDMACSVATGKEWDGKPTQQGIVLYLAAEGQQGLSRRIKAWELANHIEASNLWVLGSPLTVNDPKVQKKLIGIIKQLEDIQQNKVELVIIDTLARCIGGDENSPKDMGEFVRACDAIRCATETTIFCIHHSGKDVNKGARGSNVLVAAVDFEFKMRKMKESGLVKLINTKQKDADITPPIPLYFRPINLGIICDEGIPITSLVRLEHGTPKAQQDSKSNGNILEIIMQSPHQSMTRGELNKALFPSITSIPAGERQKVKRELDKLVENRFVTIDKKGKNSTNADLISIIH